jgi:hypothetical protein
MHPSESLETIRHASEDAASLVVLGLVLSGPARLASFEVDSDILQAGAESSYADPDHRSRRVPLIERFRGCVFFIS